MASSMYIYKRYRSETTMPLNLPEKGVQYIVHTFGTDCGQLIGPHARMLNSPLAELA